MGAIKGQKLTLANIADTLSSDLGKGDLKIVEARKNIQSLVDGYQSAIQIYEGINSTANKYLDMAKALGETTMITRLSKIIKDSSDMIKFSNQAISKIKSI